MSKPQRPFQSQIEDFFKKGKSYEQLLAEIPAEHPELYFMMTDKGTRPQCFKAMLGMIRDEFGPYNFIQTVNTSKILMFPDDTIILYDPHYQRSVETSEKVLRKTFHRDTDLSKKRIPVEKTYNPFQQEKLYSDKFNTYFNTYEAPKWQTESPEAPPTELPVIYQTFFNHLFKGDAETITYVLDWIANSLLKRNVCYLTTIGKQGIGKGTLGEIMSALHGEQNYTEIPFKSLSKQFNGLLDAKRLIYIDEFDANQRDKMDLLKPFANDRIEIEKKHQNAKIAKNFASIYLSSNHMDCVRLDADDRRFSIIDLTDIPLRNLYTEEERQQLFADENIVKLGLFLMNRKIDDKTLTKPHVSERTRQVKAESLSDWEDYMLAQLCHIYAGQSVPIKTITEKLTTEFGSKIRFGKQSLGRLTARFPGFFKLERKQIEDGTTPQFVKFALSHLQPRQVLGNLSVEDSNE